MEEPLYAGKRNLLVVKIKMGAGHFLVLLTIMWFLFFLLITNIERYYDKEKDKCSKKSYSNSRSSGIHKNKQTAKI